MLVDEMLSRQGVPGVYSIGDCARIVDLTTGKTDQMTCKEGVIQADQLSSRSRGPPRTGSQIAEEGIFLHRPVRKSRIGVGTQMGT